MYFGGVFEVSISYLYGTVSAYHGVLELGSFIVQSFLQSDTSIDNSGHLV